MAPMFSSLPFLLVPVQSSYGWFSHFFEDVSRKLADPFSTGRGENILIVPQKCK
jgi:hypothetical protein